MSIRKIIASSSDTESEPECCDEPMEMESQGECLELLKYIADELHEIHLILKPSEPQEPVEEIVSFNERR